MKLQLLLTALFVAMASASVAKVPVPLEARVCFRTAAEFGIDDANAPYLGCEDSLSITANSC